MKHNYQEIKTINKKGQSGGGTVGLVIGALAAVIIGSVFLLFLLYAVGVINIPGLFTAGSYNANTSTAAVNNVTLTVGNFTGSLPVIGTLAGVLILIAMIVILFIYLGRMRSSIGGTGGNI